MPFPSSASQILHTCTWLRETYTASGALAPEKSRNKVVLVFPDSFRIGRHIRRRMECILRTMSTLRGSFELEELKAIERCMGY